MGDGREEYWPSPEDGPNEEQNELEYTYEGTFDIKVKNVGDRYFWETAEWGQVLASGHAPSLERADTAAKTAAWQVILGRE